MRRTLLVPAAGRGTRLGSPLPKALTPVAGRPMLHWVVARHAPHCSRAVVVVNPGDRPAFEAFALQSALSIDLAEQVSPSGMLDAILCGREAALGTGAERIWITWCDQVLISRTTVDRLCAAESEAAPAAAVFPITRQTTPYIHFDRDDSGALSRVRQRREGDPMPPVGDSDAGLFSVSREVLASSLPAYAAAAPRGTLTSERNFLPFLPWLAGRTRVVTFEIPVIESHGINTPADRLVAERHLAGAT
jgi:bifunctional UDP-N-acetylglucosamine pyrophosphorylase/glucosamine-1-phosphate N-acetyltransferase